MAVWWAASCGFDGEGQDDTTLDGLPKVTEGDNDKSIIMTIPLSSQVDATYGCVLSIGHSITNDIEFCRLRTPGPVKTKRGYGAGQLQAHITLSVLQFILKGVQV